MSEQNNDLELPEGFGAPSSNEVKFKRFRLKKDNLLMTLRPLPSMKGLLQKKANGVFKKVHYGWSGRGSDPTKNFFRPFLCVEERKNGMITQECPACKYRAEYTKKQADLKTQEENIAKEVRAAAAAKGVTDETRIAAKINEKLEVLKKEKAEIVKWLKDHGTDSKWNLYAMDKLGNVGIAEIPYTLNKDFVALCKTLEGKNYPMNLTGGKEVAIKPNGRIGVYFNFIRSEGEGFNISYKVEVNKVPIGNDGAEINDYVRISDEQLKQAAEALPCLVQEVESLRIPLEKVQALVDHSRALNGGYDPDVVDSIMGKRGGSQASKAETPVAATDDDFDVPSAEVKTEAPKAETKSEPAQVNMAEATDDEFDAIFKA